MTNPLVGLKFDLGLSSTPTTALASVSWTDVTSDVLLAEGVSFNRGRGSQDDAASPGRLSFTLNNAWAALDRTNLVKYPSAESGLTGWTGANCTVDRSTAWSASGSYCYTLTASTTGNMYAVNDTARAAVTPGVTYAASVYVRAATVARTVFCTIQWLDSGLSGISWSDGPTMTDSTSADVRAYTTGVAPPGAAWAMVYPVVQGASSSEVHYFDAAMIEEGSTVGTYFDGSTSGYEWTGTAHASTSRTATSLREGRWTRGGSNVTSGWDLRVPVRVRHVTHGTLWVGFVDAAEAGWQNGVRPVVRVSASDRLARFARVKLPGLVRGEQEYDTPALAWPLDNPAGTTTVPDRLGTFGGGLELKRLGTSGAVEFAGASFDEAPAPDFAKDVAAGEGYYLEGAMTSPVRSSTGITLEAWFNVTTLAYNGILALGSAFGTAGGPYPLSVYTSSTGELVALLDDYSGAHYVNAGAVEAGRWYHLAVRLYEYGPYVVADLYLDGALVGPASRTMSWEAPSILWVGRDRYLRAVLDGSVVNVAVYPDVLDASRIALHASAGLPSGETAAARWERVCRLAGLAAADYDTTGSSLAPTPTMGTQAVKGRPYIDAAQECADVEDGVSFLDRTGVMRLHLRGVRMGATVGLTLGPADVDADTVLLSDTDRVINDVTVTRTGGASQRATNAYSVAYYGTQDDSIDLSCETDEQALNAAEWTVYERAYPDERVDAVTVDLVSKAATVSVADALTADLSTLIELDGLPTPSASSSTLSLFVEGVSDSITESSWRRTFTTSNAAKRLNVFTLDDATLGVLDTGGVLA